LQRSAQASLFHGSWWRVEFLSIIFAQIVFVPKFSVIISHSVSLLIFSYSTVILAVMCLLFRTRILTISTFQTYFYVTLPGRLSNSTSSFPSEDNLHHSEAHCFDIITSPYTSFNNSKILVSSIRVFLFRQIDMSELIGSFASCCRHTKI
jgi:hypothetical protein